MPTHTTAPAGIDAAAPAAAADAPPGDEDVTPMDQTGVEPEPSTMEPTAMEPAMEAMMAEAAMATGDGLNELTGEDVNNEQQLGAEDAAAVAFPAGETAAYEEGAEAAAAAAAEEIVKEEQEGAPVPEADGAPQEDVAMAEVVAAEDVDPPTLPPLPPPKQWPPKPGVALMPGAKSSKSGTKTSTSSKGPTYYAVRVGYAVCPSCSLNKEKSTAPCGHVSTIRSAIFLQWEDVQAFVQFATQAAPTAAATAAAAAGSSTEPSEDATAKLEGTQKEEAEEGRHRQVPFHHNVEYKQFDELERAERYLKKVIPAFNLHCTTASSGTSAKNKKKHKKSSGSGKTKIKSLSRKAPLPAYPPPKNFNPPTKKWESMYEAAVQYKATYGNLDVPMDEKAENYEEHAELSKWVKYQRTSYRYYLEDPMGGRHSMTQEKVNRLREVGFAWIVTDKKEWLAEEVETPSKKKRGRPRKSAQQKRLDQIEKEVAKAADSTNTSKEPKTPKPIRQKWLNMLEKLKEYKAENGTVEISAEETDEELSVLRQWCKNQRNMHIRWRQGHDVGMTQEKADLLKEAGMEFPPAWEDMYVKIVQYKAQNGNIDISPDYDPILAAWMARQNEVLGRHLQGKSTRLNDDQAMRLLALGFQGGRGASAARGGGSVSVTGKTVASRDFDTKWNEMLSRLKDYKAEHGHCNVPTSLGTDLAHWVAAQRRMYNKLIAGKPGKRAVLDAIKMQQLTELGFQFRPRGSYVPWEENMKGLWKFREENGHCRIPVNHPTLGSFVKLARRDYKNWMQGKPSSMTPEREAALKEVGFIFEGGKTPQRAAGPIRTWDARLEELLQYKAEFGHTVVPQNSGQLGAWVHSQRVHYKKYKEGAKSQMTAEKALKLTEIGFCFNASDRYRGNKRHRTHEQEEEEAQQLQLQQQMQHVLQHEQQHAQQHQQHYTHQIQETVQVPQGFQNYL